MTRKIYIPPGRSPAQRPPNPQIYAQMGMENIFRMLSDFYQELGKSSIRPMFSPDLEQASRRSAAFFVSVLGGPPLYQQLYGAPRMRERHLPFLIDEKARIEWLECFKRVLANAPEKYNFPAEHLPGFIEFLDGFSGWMVNTAPEDAESQMQIPLRGGDF